MEGYKTITLDGQEYYLVPKLSSGETANSSLPPEDIISGYLDEEKDGVEVDILSENVDVKTAEPKLSDHRKRFLERRLEPEDINSAKGVPNTAIRQFGEEPEISQAQYKGEKLFFGEGLQTG